MKPKDTSVLPRFVFVTRRRDSEEGLTLETIDKMAEQFNMNRTELVHGALVELHKATYGSI